MTNVVEKAKSIWSAKREKMTIEDWTIIGEALLEGRKLNPSNNKFKAWCEVNGFGDIKRQVRADAMWLTSNQAKSFVVKLLDNGITHPVNLHSAFRKDKLLKLENKLGCSISNAILSVVTTRKAQTKEQIAQELDVDVEDIRRRFPDLKKKGLIEETDSGAWKKVAKSKVPAAQEKAEEEIPVSRITRMNMAALDLSRYISSAKTNEAARARIDAVKEIDISPDSKNREYVVAPGRIQITHVEKIGDAMQKATHQGVNGVVKVTTIVEVIDA